MEDNGRETAPLGVWIGLTFIAVVSFWSQATVTEERFVPALNVIATKFNIPMDVAGATLMAAGASSPELFSSFVSLFITHSALGLGTIVGSEIFNQLVICAGAVYAARSGSLKLDKAILVREVGFYALAIILLRCALQDHRPVDGDSEDHIFISFMNPAISLEHIFCMFSSARSLISFVRFSIPRNERRLSLMKKLDMAQLKAARFEFPEMPFLRETYTHEPEDNFVNKTNTAMLYRTPTGEKRIEPMPELSVGELMITDDGVKTREVVASGLGGENDFRFSTRKESGVQNTRQRSSLETSIRSIVGTRRFSDGASLRRFNFLVDTEKPSDEYDLFAIEKFSFDENLCCFLWQRSIFYDKARFFVHAWDKRWFTFTRDKVFSVPDRAQYEKHVMVYPRFLELEVDEVRYILKIKNPDESKRNYYFMAPTPEVFEAVLQKCEQIIQFRKEQADATNEEVNQEVEGNAEYEESSLIEFPVGRSSWIILAYLVLFPLTLCMHWTIPDVRHIDPKGNQKSSLTTAFIAVAMSLVWLIIGSYAMVASLENLADIMNVPDAIVGVTVSAAGTSLPNYIASKIAAEKGFGNMAVSNAFGSNTFNILVGLGLPWLLYTSFGTGFQPYHSLRNEGIIESVFILGFVLLIFIVAMCFSGFMLLKWHGHLFIGLYAAYLAFAIGQVYW